MALALMGPGGGKKLQRVTIGTCYRHSYIDNKSFTFSATSVPNYQKLTDENFAINVTEFYASGDCNGVGSHACSLTYDSSSGTITVTIGGEYGYKSAGCTVVIYCYYVG